MERYSRRRARKPYFRKLAAFVEAERKSGDVFPPPSDVYNALAHTPYLSVRVAAWAGPLPRYRPGHGLCFSVKEGTRLPPSLANIFKELKTDLGISPPQTGCLTPWTRQGVLLLNAVLTVPRMKPIRTRIRDGRRSPTRSSRRSMRKPSRWFLCYGAGMREEGKADRRQPPRNHQVGPPSAAGAHNGFFGSRPFSKINATIREFGGGEIDWRLCNRR